MLYPLPRLRVAVVVLVMLFCDSPLARGAQRAAAAPEEPGQAKAVDPQVLVTSEQDARETRTDFENVLKRLPPSVGRVMRLDPSLMRNQTYLAPYPTLSAFLQTHPAVVQNPGYYLEHIEDQFWNPREPQDAKSQTLRIWEEMFQGFAIFVVLSTVTSAVLWLLKTLVEHRRWYSHVEGTDRGAHEAARSVHVERRFSWPTCRRHPENASWNRLPCRSTVNRSPWRLPFRASSGRCKSASCSRPAGWARCS